MPHLNLITTKRFFFRLLRRIPMPLLAILIGLMAGLAVWGVLDHVQSRAVTKIFKKELKAQLDLRSRESLIRFDQFVANYAATARLLANHRRLAQYLEPLFWFPEEAVKPVVYEGFLPIWLHFLGRDALPAPGHVLLVDTQGMIREIYRTSQTELPRELQGTISDQFLDESKVRTVLTRFDDQPYLLVSDATEDAGGYSMGSLVMVVPINDEFLSESQKGLSLGRAVVALVDSDDQRVLASMDPSLLIPGTLVDEWTDAYTVTFRSFDEYEGSDWNVMLATFVPHDSVAKMSKRVRKFERRQRLIAAVVFIGVFTLVIYLVSARLNKVLRRMSLFSQRALGIQNPRFSRGANQLLLLEDWIRQFTQLVLKAREEMSRKHESEMRASEALKTAILEASLDSIITIDQNGRIIEFNPTAEQSFGFTRAQVIGRNFPELFLAPPDVGVFGALLEASRATTRKDSEHYARGELTAVRADRLEVPVEVSVVPIWLESELVYTVYMHDITKRKQAEREIKELARFASESPNPIMRVSANGTLVYANAASEALLNYWGCRPGEGLPAFWTNQIALALEEGGNPEHVVDCGGQVYSLLLAPIRDLAYVNVYGRDVTAVRRAEQEARQHQAELVHVCRLSTMGEVATGMAHELNQPLSAIVNFANGCNRRLQSGIGGKNELMDAMGQITSQAQRASEIIRRLRALVGKQPPMRSRVDLNRLVLEVCSFVEYDTHKLGVTLELDLAERELPVNVDLVQIEQVLLNLVRNALDALEEMPHERRRLVIRTGSSDGGVRVEVEDYGPGIPPDQLDSLFDPFFTTKESGMGMGLPISQTIIDDHEGRIWATSESGKGAVFHVVLPAATAQLRHRAAGMA